LTHWLLFAIQWVKVTNSQHVKNIYNVIYSPSSPLEKEEKSKAQQDRRRAFDSMP